MLNTSPDVATLIAAAARATAWKRRSTSATRCSPPTWTMCSAGTGSSSASSRDVPEPGDYVAVDIGRNSVLLVRDDDLAGSCLPQRLPPSRHAAVRDAAGHASATSSAPTTSGPTTWTARCIYADICRPISTAAATA